MGLLSGFDTATAWTLLQKNGAAIEKGYAAGTSSASDIAYFKSVASTLTSPDALLKNFRALSFVTTSFGLGSQTGQTALLKKLMTQDPTSTSSLAQQLSDNRYRNFANALSSWSPPPFSTKAGVDSTVAGYQQQSFEDSIGQDSVALQEASYFSRNAVGITKLSQIMADKPLLDVVRTGLGIPDSFSSLNYDQQVAILKPRVDLSQFATAAGVSKMITKYLAMDTLKQVQAGTGSDPVLSLFNGGSSASSGLTLTAKSLSGGGLNLFA